MQLRPALQTLFLRGRRGLSAAAVAPPIGVMPLVLWDARTGIQQNSGVTRWTDVIRGVQLNDNGATTRPVYAADYDYFGGQKVVQFDGVNDTLRNLAISPEITLVGARPYWFCVFRYRGSSGVLFEPLPSNLSTAMPQVSRNSGILQAIGLGGTVSVGDPFGAQHVCEHFISASAGTMTFGLDGVDVTGATGQTYAVATGALFLGNYNGTAHSAVSIAAIGCYAAELTAPQRVALRDHYAAAFPAPPLTPPDFLSNLLVWVDPAYCTTSIGKIANFTNRGSLGGTIAQASTGLRSTLTAADARFANKASFNGSSSGLQYPLPALGAPAAAECFVVGVHANDPPPSGAETGFEVSGSAAQSADFPYTDRTLYGSFASSARKTCGISPVNLTQPWLVNMWSAPGDWALRINRSTFYSTASNTVGYGSSPPPTILRGAGATYFIGSWAAYFFCGSKQSPAQRAQMEAWVLSTYGV